VPPRTHNMGLFLYTKKKNHTFQQT